jgi:hypothetical protein
VAWNGLPAAVSNLLATWQPGQLVSELAYKDALFHHLAALIPKDCHVEREYRHAGTTADLHLAWTGVIQRDEIFFELKRDLTGKSECDRLVGQIEGLKPRSNKIVVVLVGATRPELLSRLRQHCERYTSEPEPSMAIVTIPT